ncbi:MAG: NAD(P)H-hydrate dehydratase [Desulfovibrio sp.]|jgi:NAD(P)H-hydrate epimerase|nr:NAD(P)H-hydrate dehydratase [Desulfovibrio sp.]
MFEPLPTPAEMAAWDQAAIKDYGLKAELLMENAGAAALDALEQDYGPLDGAQVLLVAGGGNNGGDAFVLARRLLDEGAIPLVLHTKPRSKYTAEARYHLDLARRAGVELKHLPLERAAQVLDGLDAPDILVDGLLGTGFTGELSPEAAFMVRAMNSIGEEAFVLALDIPSGLCGLTGLPRPVAVQADLTVAFHAPKLGSALPQAAPYVGELVPRHIGIPRAATLAAPCAQSVITEDILDLLRAPAADLHKGKAGHVLVIGGSEGLTGAAQLCGLGALRAGAGLVTLACPRGVLAEVKAGMPDLMALPLGPASAPQWTPDCLEELLPHLSRFDAIVLGPGLGRGPGAADFLAAFCEAFAKHFSLEMGKAWAPPCIFDADALFHLAQKPKLMDALPKDAVLTPHPGEMARILGMGMGELQADRAAAARRFTSAHTQVLTLKGAGTLVGQDGKLMLCPVAAPNLAVGGSGDVLAGVMAACLSRGIAPLHAACVGVYWHAQAGLRLSCDFPSRGNLPTEIAHILPLVLKERAQC